MDSQEHIKSIDRKIFLMFAVIASVTTILLAAIAVLLEIHWAFVLAIGLFIGIITAQINNWFTEKVALKYNLVTEPSWVEKAYKPRPKPVKSLVVYQTSYENEPVKDPWIHDDDPNDFK